MGECFGTCMVYLVVHSALKLSTYDMCINRSETYTGHHPEATSDIATWQLSPAPPLQEHASFTATSTAPGNTRLGCLQRLSNPTLK